MNRSVEEIGGGVLVVSQFTLAARTRKGRRPSYTDAADPAEAKPLCERFAARLTGRGLTVATGRFGAMMDVELVNDGPVTILLEPPGGRGS
jgi:D-tyrosyl-tRNA(Tyr) deacylase